MAFDYTVTTKKSFAEAVAEVERETVRVGFKVLYVHDIASALKEKGFELEPFKIIEVCSAQSANRVLKADIKMGLCLPCKINVYQKGGQTFISGMRPILLSQLFPQADLGSFPAEVDGIVRKIIDRSK
ncbi:MAG: hypothetical protein UX85_C0004G0204 [Candidatus Beckwithbacteria bacterium GW2011_GWB1_47_15]|uniref:DUF302 domain-containing protein n=1 Tax=Candidatus Beckwithbacteria bacterium GW2011_GWB1_47_15 TaxID=1618371 RepID=A0A0G1RVW9_9BACT|nr:MAG: hypothetical protein UY43_C0001G0030 [Candidatus Beckwithbacteria bacterium GW2011_GWC1_49_16]KKU34970.1 MAG: hypothetical protein UX50_C0007G0005 [Candidatus Beckwithbacteria bacterium GW2011_GWA1_46_30]KKU61282.1 MAG: hypothetical protein UX85_C0004G0204 [Candidatus Beckwithbacteria bacterium GW2011_GWB1_47_15]KKU71421.1 MAG: hypothetical protein UX97_C0006G0005 [Candidatus Beckwithbacteria bacterium GW2011_GWA2_47_25]KKW03091.1 MAG: hypothetical protein UY37_C0007G0045 [Candidatus Be